MTRSRWRFWASLLRVTLPGELRRCGVLGMNRRNADYILPCNPRSCYPQVDDKLLTKQICERRGIPVPRTFAVIERQGDVRKFPGLLGDRRQFVVKPTAGSEGRGIVVVTDRRGDELTTAANERLTAADLRYHLSTILAGLYSLGGQPDRAIVEQRILRHPAFERVAVGGTPDVRVIVYRGVPVMAMVRLPTRASRGRANLHQGAVGVGVDLQSGTTFGGVCNLRAVRTHPDTGHPIAGLKVPQWHALLDAAVELADSLELGYLGVDFVLDESLGPVVLEANARPGLAIQIANRTGLLPGLRRVDGGGLGIRGWRLGAGDWGLEIGNGD